MVASRRLATRGRRVPPGVPLPPRRILIVDDEPAIREVVAEYLATLGHDVTAAASGKEALDVLATGEHRFDVAIVDWFMPGITGRDVVADVARRSPTTAVLVTTGRIDPMSTPQIRNHPIRVLLKPFSLRDLRGEIETVVAEQGKK